MVGRLLLSHVEPGFTLPAFERLAPPPPAGLVAARIEAHAGPGDIVADLHGRGGWVARAAIDRQRRAFSLETSPLTRLLAEVVLRPPDIRHLDAAFSSLGASARGDSSLKLSIGDLFGTTCATCGRSVVMDELVWTTEKGATEAAPVTKHYRCSVCRDQQRGGEQRTGPPDEADLRRARSEVGAAAVRRHLRGRFPVPDGGEGLVAALLGLHTDRQLVGLGAILDRLDGDLRAAPVESALRLAFLHAVLPASRLGTGPGRIPVLKIAAGTIKTPIPETWRERNPWLAFEEGFRLVRTFVQRLEGEALGPLEARVGSDLQALVEGPATAVIRVATPSALATLASEAKEPSHEPGTPGPGRARVRLVLGQPPARFSQERLAAAYHGTCWTLGRDAAALLPLEPLLAAPIRAPWSWQAAALRRSLEAISPHMARDGRVVMLLESGGADALVAAILGGVGAGYRLVEARLADAHEEIGGVVELVPPAGILPPGPRTRGNAPLEPNPGDLGDPGLIPSAGLFSPPERIDARPFSANEAARSISETAIEVLKARGEPARYERLLGDVLVGLDRSGQLRRLMASDGHGEEASGVPASERSTAAGASPRASGREGGPRARLGEAALRAGLAGKVRIYEPGADPVERVLALVRDELQRPGQRRLVEIEPGRWWLGDRQDREAAAVPLADRVEWAVYSLLSTAGPISENACFERIATLFAGHDLPDEALVRACLASYRSPASTPDRISTDDDLRRRTAEQTELLALLANGGHALGMSVWIGRREQSRPVGGMTLRDYLGEAEREPWLPSIAAGPVEDLEAVDCIWYLRNRTAIAFEVEWTAMLGDLLLRRHARIPAEQPNLVRILAVPPERAELVRHKLDASPVLRGALEAANWHLILWNHLRQWLGREPFDLDALEPYLGLDATAAERGEQLGLFETVERLG